MINIFTDQIIMTSTDEAYNLLLIAMKNWCFHGVFNYNVIIQKLYYSQKNNIAFKNSNFQKTS